MVEFSRRNTPKNKKPLQGGFTIVELLIVVVVIAILAAVTIMSYNGITARAQQSKIAEDMANLQKAIVVARKNTGRTLLSITGNGYTASSCSTKPAGTDLAELARTDSCWTVYLSTLDKISIASGTSCNKDGIAVYANPVDGAATTHATNIPLSGSSGCS